MITINENNDISIYNVIPVFRGNRPIKFVTVISIKEIDKIYDKLIYDAHTQRGIKELKNGKIKYIMNEDNIEEIKDKVLHDFFDGGHLTWNVRINSIGDYKKYFDYNPDDNILIIKSGFITLPNSAQRHKALCELANSPNLDTSSYYLPLDICFYTFEEEQNYFAEVNGTGQKANKTRALYLSHNWKAELTKELIMNTELNGKVELINQNKGNNVVTFAVLYNSLFDKTLGAYRDIKQKDAEIIKKWLIKFYSELLELRPELKNTNPDDRQKLEKEYLSYTNPMWFAYASISRSLYNDELVSGKRGYWKSKLKKLNNAYDKYPGFKGDILSIKNPLWHHTICMQNPIRDENGNFVFDKNGNIVTEYRVIQSNRTYKIAGIELAKYLKIGIYK